MRSRLARKLDTQWPSTCVLLIVVLDASEQCLTRLGMRRFSALMDESDLGECGRIFPTGRCRVRFIRAPHPSPPAAIRHACGRVWLRNEGPNKHLSPSLAATRWIMYVWRTGYSIECPQSSLGCIRGERRRIRCSIMSATILRSVFAASGHIAR